MMGAYPRSVYASGMNKANFSRMDQSTAEDWQVIMTEQKGFMKGLPDKILAHMELLGGDYGGFPIDRLQHSLQTAHLAAEAGEDEEFIVCALLHDIGDTLGPVNHADVAAVILEPFVSEANHWMVKHHAIFQGYHFFHHLGLDRHMRDGLRDSEYFERTLRFVDEYDNPAFDACQPEMSLDLFEPMVRRVFARPRKSLYKEAFDPE